MATDPTTLAIVREAMRGYAKPSLSGEPSYLTESADGTLFTIVDVSRDGTMHRADVSLAVQFSRDAIIIEHDMNNKPLVAALLQAGIPRSAIILAYAGEPVPESA
jgi:hypothetical protein